MYTNEDFAKLFDINTVRFSTLKHFAADPRLVSPFGIAGSHEYAYQFAGMETYPEELSELFYYNGY